MSGIRREGQGRRVGQVTGITFMEARFLTGQTTRGGVRGLRDAAMFSLMSDYMVRVSELVAVHPREVSRLLDGTGRLHLP